MATITVGPSGRDYTTINAALAAANDSPASRAAMDLILVDAGTYTESLDARPGAGWIKPVIIRAADPDNRPVIASTGGSQALRADGTYRVGNVELTLEDLIFSGWTAASNGVIYTPVEGIVIRRCHFTGNTNRRVLRWIGGTATRYGLVDSCTFETSGNTGSGEAGIILTWTVYAVVKNCKAICPTNVQFLHDAYTGPQYVEHNSVLGTWNTGGNCKAIKGVGTHRGNLIQNLGTGGSHAIDATGGTYTENKAYGTFTTRFAGTDGGENYNEDPLFTNTGTGDLTLQLASPAIRSLARSANTLLDIEGDTRSDPTDAGAYEMVIDSTPPTITGWTRTSKSTVVLTFSEDLDETSAETSGNYTTNPTRSVTAVLSPANVVTLTLSPEVDTLILTVANVEDLAGNAMASWSREIGWSTGSDTDAAVIYAVADDGSSVGYLPGWDPMPSGVGSEATLERLVFVSLFSDARIADDQTPPDGTNDRRGWWADTDEDDNTGSTLWYLQGRAGVTAREYEDAIKASLQWMIADAVCTSVAVTATLRSNQVGATIDLTLVSGDVRRVAYPDLWSTANAA